jgi:hypothetical protein
VKLAREHVGSREISSPTMAFRPGRAYQFGLMKTLSVET